MLAQDSFDPLVGAKVWGAAAVLLGLVLRAQPGRAAGAPAHPRRGASWLRLSAPGGGRRRPLPPSCAPANASAAILETRALTVTAGGRTILRDVNLGVAARGVFGLIGPSGAGKSTLLRCLNRLDRA